MESEARATVPHVHRRHLIWPARRIAIPQRDQAVGPTTSFSTRPRPAASRAARECEKPSWSKSWAA